MNTPTISLLYGLHQLQKFETYWNTDLLAKALSIFYIRISGSTQTGTPHYKHLLSLLESADTWSTIKQIVK